VQAINGWSRWVQPDTLTTGTENVWCNTADRAGDNNAIRVNCQTSGGPGSQGNSKPADVTIEVQLPATVCASPISEAQPIAVLDGDCAALSGFSAACAAGERGRRHGRRSRTFIEYGFGDGH
jgi:hypothetical protein